MTGGGPTLLLERFIGRGTDGLGIEAASMVRRCNAFALIGLVGAAYSVPFHLVAVGLRPLGLGLVALDLASFAVLWGVRRWMLVDPGTARARVVGHLLAGVAMVFIAVPTLLSGHGSSPIATYLVVVPFAAVYVLGWRAGVAWAAVSGAVLVGIHLADGRLGVAEEAMFPLLQAQLTLLVIVTMFAAATQRVNQRQLATIDDLASELAVHNRRLERRSIRLEEDRDRAIADSRWSEARFEAGFESSPIGLALIDTDGRIQRVNPALCATLGYDEAELVRRRTDTLADPDQELSSADLLDALRSGEQKSYATDRKLVRSDGSLVWARLHITALRDDSGFVDGFFAQVEDVTAAREAAANLAHRAAHDSLTGLANRVKLIDELDLRLEAHASGGAAVSVLFVDIDQFKIVNDALGHSTGDRLLVDVAARLRDELTSADLVARLGGDEFAIVASAPVDAAGSTGASVDTVEASRNLAAHVHELLHRPFAFSGQEVSVTASIGVAHSDANGLTAEDLLRHADAAMYRSKDEGRATTRMFDDSMRRILDERYRLARALSTALDLGQLRVHFQPEIDLRSGTIVGAEALLRWEHPERGLLAAGAFIELAEETGLIVSMGRWAVGEALRHATRWSVPGSSPMLTRVNLSANQLAQDDLVAVIREQLAGAGVEPEQVCFEITESALVETGRSAMANIGALRDLGARLAIDDFGTGYASLTYLKQLPADALKIDQSFVRGMVDDPRDRAIVASVIDLADRLGFETVAEGVESEEQAQLLVDLGCDRAQGYHWYHPMPAEELITLVES